MKTKLLLTSILMFFLISKSISQVYNSVNYSYNGTPTNGVKIKTNFPFTPFSQMPTIIIEGYNFGTSEPIGLIINYYIYSGGTDFSDPANFYFHNPSMSSYGGYTPNVYIANENGKVVLFVDHKEFYQRFTVRCFGKGMSEQPNWFSDWTIADEPNTGSKSTLIPYKNKFKGMVSMPGNGVWNSDGNVGIGTTTPTEKLSVKGKIRAHEIKVETANWPDYVFAKDYQLPSLRETEKHIKEKGHLPGIPSATEVKANGIDLGEMNAKLLQKIEEITLHLINKDKEITDLKKQMQQQDIKINQMLKLTHHK